MASITCSVSLKINQFPNSRMLTFCSSHNHVSVTQSVGDFNFGISHQFSCTERSLYPCNPHQVGSRYVCKQVSAVGSGLEASLTEDNAIVLKKATIAVESRDDDKMQVRVDVPGQETQKVFNVVLRNLARTAPPIPGFRRDKGGKTTNVPTDFLLQILGEERVTKFVIQEIVSSSLADYVKKEKLTVKENKVSTSQTAEELEQLFIPGSDFGFNATLEFEKLETETGGDDDSTEVTVDVEATSVA